MWERMASSTRVWCQRSQPIGLHCSLGRFTRSASESPWRAGCTKVFVLKVRVFATTVCTSILILPPCHGCLDVLRLTSPLARARDTVYVVLGSKDSACPAPSQLPGR